MRGRVCMCVHVCVTHREPHGTMNLVLSHFWEHIFCECLLVLSMLMAFACLCKPVIGQESVTLVKPVGEFISILTVQSYTGEYKHQVSCLLSSVSFAHVLVSVIT